jgi:hypothetical protein
MTDRTHSNSPADSPATRAAIDRGAAAAVAAVTNAARKFDHLDPAVAVDHVGQRLRVVCSPAELAMTLAALAVRTVRADQYAHPEMLPAANGAMVRLARVLAEIAATDPSRHGHAGPDTPEITARYARRNALIWSVLALAHEAGVPAGVGHDPADPRPIVVYIELPGAGQISWHLPAHQVEWDGHTTATKYERVDAFVSAAAGEDDHGA